MQRSHNQNTYPAGKFIPVEVLRLSVGWKFTSLQRRLLKKLHTRKSRAFLKKESE